MVSKALRVAVIGVVAATVLSWVTGVAVADSTPDGGVDAARWTAQYNAPPQYPRMHVDYGIPIRMSDGVVLKADLYRPADAAGRPVNTPLPTLLQLTPYTKLATALGDLALHIPVLSNLVLNWLNSINASGTPFSSLGDLMNAAGNRGPIRLSVVDRKMVQDGYATLEVDVRGTGTSEGDWQIFRPREKQDANEVVNWAASQPWSDGKVGAYGVSQIGMGALQAAVEHPPALKAIVATDASADVVHDLVAPGGGFGFGFIVPWLMIVDGGKWVPDLQGLLQGKFDWRWLADRIKDPVTFLKQAYDAMTIPDLQHIPPDDRPILDASSAQRRALQFQTQKIKAATMVIGGWHDIFPFSESREYNSIPLPTTQKKLIMENRGYHGTPGANTGRPGTPPNLGVLQKAWFDKWLKGIDNGIDHYGPVVLEQQGGGWVGSPTFPQPGVDYRRLYLSSARTGTTGIVAHDGSLVPGVPNDTTRLTVAPGLSSLCSRSTTQVLAGGTALLDACAKDSRINEVAALAFTSRPVSAPTTVSGTVSVHLNTVQDAPDGYYTATLNDVAPDGFSTMLANGQIVTSVRAVDESKSKRGRDGAYQQVYLKLDLAHVLPVVPGAPTPVDFSFPGTDLVLQPGHRLRVDVYAMNFPMGIPLRPMLNNTKLLPEHIQLDPHSPSWINVPSTRPIP